MVKTWKVEDAREDFDAILQASATEGPQTITRRGVEVAVLLPINQSRRPDEETEKRPKYRNLKEWLMAPEPRTENLAAPRLRPTKRRPPPTFED